MLELPANETILTLEGSKHWIIDSSIVLDKTISLRDLSFDKDKVKAISVFEGIYDPSLVNNYFDNQKRCKLDFLATSDKGIIAGIECKSFPLDEAVKEIVDKTYSRLWIRSNPDKLVSLIIQCPKNLDMMNETKGIFKKLKLTLQPESETKPIRMQIPLPQTQEPELNESYIELAKTLILSGHYSTPHPPGINHDNLAKKLGISKPTFERRKRELEKIGLKKLFDIQGFSDDEIEDSFNLLSAKIKFRQ